MSNESGDQADETVGYRYTTAVREACGQYNETDAVDVVRATLAVNETDERLQAAYLLVTKDLSQAHDEAEAALRETRYQLLSAIHKVQELESKANKLQVENDDLKSEVRILRVANTHEAQRSDDLEDKLRDTQRWYAHVEKNYDGLSLAIEKALKRVKTSRSKRRFTEFVEEIESAIQVE